MNNEISAIHNEIHIINLQYEKFIRENEVKNIVYLHDKMNFVTAFKTIKQNNEFILQKLRDNNAK
jgi:hypothetical protein